MTLKENVKKFIKDLEKEVIELENTSGTETKVRRDTLDEVIDWLEVLLDANEWTEFKKK